MRILKKLEIGQLNVLEEIPLDQQSSFIGGDGDSVNCLWNCLGKLQNMYDGNASNDYSDLANATYADQMKQNYENYAKANGLSVTKNGDPDISDSKFIMDFIKETFNVMDGNGSDGEDTWIGSGVYGSDGEEITDNGIDKVMKESKKNNKEKKCTDGEANNGTVLIIEDTGSGYHAVIAEGTHKTESDYEQRGESYWDVYDPEDKQHKVHKNEIVLAVGIGQKETTGSQQIEVTE